MDEVVKAPKSTKFGKAAGYDKVSSEMLRCGGGIMASLLYQLFDQYWKSCRVLNGWCKAVIVLLYNGSRQVHKLPLSYLLSAVGKLYTKIIIERVMYETKIGSGTYKRDFEMGWGVRTKFFLARHY
ncbi:hypothetical protein EVAR_39819_1 [Eumeta japonica]|uniref:Uncharacterized protein n=1 Tax=Eumeta variegata TaxID=151549 RepID=A0A4C1X920_EUMVA|nr:hypothetical protein EVAR_39819_1 [Eumeta japonica]